MLRSLNDHTKLFINEEDEEDESDEDNRSIVDKERDKS